MNHLPSVSQAYLLINLEETQRGLTIGMNNTDTTAFLSNNYKTEEKFSQESNKKNSLECECCHMSRHKKENCYKLVSYTPRHKLHKAKREVPINRQIRKYPLQINLPS